MSVVAVGRPAIQRLKILACRSVSQERLHSIQSVVRTLASKHNPCQHVAGRGSCERRRGRPWACPYHNVTAVGRETVQTPARSGRERTRRFPASPWRMNGAQAVLERPAAGELVQMSCPQCRSSCFPIFWRSASGPSHIEQGVFIRWFLPELLTAFQAGRDDAPPASAVPDAIYRALALRARAAGKRESVGGRWTHLIFRLDLTLLRRLVTTVKRSLSPQPCLSTNSLHIVL
jgi:hypothetical protein